MVTGPASEKALATPPRPPRPAPRFRPRDRVVLNSPDSIAAGRDAALAAIGARDAVGSNKKLSLTEPFTAAATAVAAAAAAVVDAVNFSNASLSPGATDATDASVAPSAQAMARRATSGGNVLAASSSSSSNPLSLFRSLTSVGRSDRALVTSPPPSSVSTAPSPSAVAPVLPRRPSSPPGRSSLLDAPAESSTDLPSAIAATTVREPASADAWSTPSPAASEAVTCAVELLEVLLGCCKPFADAVGEPDDVRAGFVLADASVRHEQRFSRTRWPQTSADTAQCGRAPLPPPPRQQRLRQVPTVAAYPIFLDLVGGLRTVRPQTLPVNERVCFFLNVYNALWSVSAPCAGVTTAVGALLWRRYRTR